MGTGIRTTARITSATGLSAIAALHAIWASGSPWPATNKEQLAESVVGQPLEMPSAAPTAVVAAGAAGFAVVAAGAGGNRRLRRLALRGMSIVMLLRATVGGDVALAALGLPASGERFRSLDRRYYRPFAALLGTALWIASSRDRRPIPDADEPHSRHRVE